MTHSNCRSLIRKTEFSQLLLFFLLWLPVSQAGAQETYEVSPDTQDPAITATRVQYPRNSRLTTVRLTSPTEVLSDERFTTSVQGLNTTTELESYFDRNLPSRTDVVIEGQPAQGSSEINNRSSVLRTDPIRLVPPSWDYGLNLSRNNPSADSGQPADPSVSADSGDTSWPNDTVYPSEWNNPDQTPVSEPADPGNSLETYADGCPKSDSNTPHVHEIGLDEISSRSEWQALDMLRSGSGLHGAAFYQRQGEEQEVYLRRGPMQRIADLLQALQADANNSDSEHDQQSDDDTDSENSYELTDNTSISIADDDVVAEPAPANKKTWDEAWAGFFGRKLPDPLDAREMEEYQDSKEEFDKHTQAGAEFTQAAASLASAGAPSPLPVSTAGTVAINETAGAVVDAETSEEPGTLGKIVNGIKSFGRWVRSWWD